MKSLPDVVEQRGKRWRCVLVLLLMCCCALLYHNISSMSMVLAVDRGFTHARQFSGSTGAEDYEI